MGNSIWWPYKTVINKLILEFKKERKKEKYSNVMYMTSVFLFYIFFQKKKEVNFNMSDKLERIVEVLREKLVLERREVD